MLYDIEHGLCIWHVCMQGMDLNHLRVTIAEEQVCLCDVCSYLKGKEPHKQVAMGRLVASQTVDYYWLQNSPQNGKCVMYRVPL